MRVDANYIVSGLYQGSEPPTGTILADQGFRLLVLCARGIQPPAAAFPGMRVIHCPLEDDQRSALSESEWRRARGAAVEIAVAMRQGLSVLVTCAAGINRSAVVTALALHELYGYSGRAAADVVRGDRTVIFMNLGMLRQLHALPAVAR